VKLRSSLRRGVFAAARIMGAAFAAALLATAAVSAPRAAARARCDGSGTRDDGAGQAGTSYSDPSHLDQARRMAERALAFLASHMTTNGSFERVSGDMFPRVACASLAALAFMANGHTADDGNDRYGPQLRLLLDWLLTQAQVKPCNCAAIPGAHDLVKFVDPNFNMSESHGHGYATWALAMAYGMSFGAENTFQRDKVKSLLQGAVHAIELSQSDTGGWMYQLEKSDHEGSVTVTLLQALRAAKESGVRVNAKVIDEAVKYLRKSQKSQPTDRDSPDFGAFRYRWGDEKVTFALTAAAVSSLNQTGDYDSKNVDLGIEYMRQKDPLTTLNWKESNWRWYERLYAAQAYFQYRDLKHFRQWYPRLVEVAANEQQRDGSFSDTDFGDIYATATAALTLAVPFGYLPTYQR
jgi:hypothetical protein